MKTMGIDPQWFVGLIKKTRASFAGTGSK